MSSGLLRVPGSSIGTQDDTAARSISNYGTLPRGQGGGIISPNTGRIIPLSKYQPQPTSTTSLHQMSQSRGSFYHFIFYF